MKGHPILGIISGFLFGLFGGIALFLYGAIPLHSQLLWILPLVGIVLGLFMAAWAPFGSSGKPAVASTEGVSYASAGDADPSATAGTTLEQDTVDVRTPPDDADDNST